MGRQPSAKQNRDAELRRRTQASRGVRPASGAKTGHSSQTATMTRQRNGMQVRVNDAQRMRPQKKQSSQRPLGGRRTGRARREHLRKVIKKKQRRATWSKIIAFLLSIICGTLALTAFFNVETLEVVGLSRYTQEEVLQTFGVVQGDNLIFCDSWRGKKRVLEQYPYFEAVAVARDLPSRLVLQVTESEPIAAISSTQGDWLVVDKNCRVLEHTDPQTANGIAEVMGIRTEGAVEGKVLPSDASVKALQDLANALERAELDGKATLYNLEDLNKIWFLYDNRFAVCVGDTTRLEQKLSILRELVNGDLFAPTDKGTIDLSMGDRAVTNMNLSAAAVEKAARGQATIQRIDNGTPQEESETDESTEDDEQ